MEINLRSIEVSMPVPEASFGSKGYFHRWCDRFSWEGPPDYPLRKTFALIEFQDGSVKLLDPEAIRFLEPFRKAH